MELKLIVSDLDGTISFADHREHYIAGDNKNWKEFYKAASMDEPNLPVIRLLQALKQANNGNTRIEIWSGRSDEVEKETIEWLAIHDVPYDLLLMRPQNDYRQDYKLKQKWFEQSMRDAKRGIPNIVLDDRQQAVDMWRSLNVTCFQVAYGDF